MFSVTCSGCNVTRVVKNRPKSGVKSCMKCSLAKRSLKPKVVYTRVCSDCGDIATLKHKSSAIRCNHCSSKILGKQLSQGNIKEEKDKKKYIYFCPTCPNVRVIDAKRRGVYCGDCSRRYSRLVKPNIYYDYELNKIIGKPMRYFAICTDCDEDNACRQVKTRAQAGFVKCRSHSKVGSNSERKPGTKEARKRNLKARIAKLPEPIYVTGQQKVNISLVPKTKQDDENAKAKVLIDEWLKSNKVTVIERPKLPDSMIGQTDSSMYIKG